jgi:hypothetical protein
MKKTVEYFVSKPIPTAFEDWNWRQRDRQSRRDLRQAATTQFFGHQAADNDCRSLRQHGEESQPNHGKPEDLQADSLHEWRKRRIRHESPVKMAGIAEELEFVAMEAVAAIGEHVNQGHCRGDGKQPGPLWPGLAIETRRTLHFIGWRHITPFKICL